MLKRLIESWLTSISEREFDLPFRLLLEAEGHTAIGYTTIHGAMELGKDVVSWKQDDNIHYFFQTKSGNATLSSWNEMERQIRQMIEVPYIHPNYSVGDPYQPVWVCTGQLDESVRFSLGLKNEELRKIGKPTIQVWERNDLIEKYVATFFDVVFIDDYFILEFMRVWSNSVDYLSDEAALRGFFTDYLKSCPKTGKRKIQRFHAAYTLMLTQIAQKYTSIDNLYSCIDALLLGIVVFFEHITDNELPNAVYSHNLVMLEEQLGDYLSRLIESCCQYSDQLTNLLESGSGLSEIFELPLRVHSLASKLALAILFPTSRHSSQEIEVFLTVVRNNQSALCHIITERQMGTFWLVVLALVKIENHKLAEECVVSAFDWILSFHGQETSRGLPDPYQPYKIVAHHHLGIEPDDSRLVNMNGQSYFLSILLKFLSHLRLRYYVARRWQLMSGMLLQEFHFSNINEFFKYRTDNGITLSYAFPIMGSWAKIQNHFKQRLNSDFSAILDKHPESLLFLSLTYPWRTQWRETDRYL